MEKLLRPKDRILLTLNLLADLRYEYFEPVSMTMAKIRNALPWNYKPPSFYAAFHRSLRTNEIKKITKEGKIFYQFTSIGKKKLIRRFPLLTLQQKKWDGWWRIVIFDITEKNKMIRDRLRNKLKELGFGMWQESVYICPFNIAEDIRQYLVGQGLKDQACVLVAKDLFGGDLTKLVVKIWNLEIINKQYESLIEKWEWAKSPAANLTEAGLRKEARVCYGEYLEIITQDPFLPKELLPADWWGDDARKLVKEWTSYF